MVLAVVELGTRENQVLTIIKGKFGLKNKSEAVNIIIGKYEEEFLEPELRPEFIERAKNAEQGKAHKYKTLNELRRDVENA